jgi:hypothetical protein
MWTRVSDRLVGDAVGVAVVDAPASDCVDVFGVVVSLVVEEAAGFTSEVDSPPVWDARGSRVADAVEVVVSSVVVLEDASVCAAAQLNLKATGARARRVRRLITANAMRLDFIHC